MFIRRLHYNMINRDWKWNGTGKAKESQTLGQKTSRIQEIKIPPLSRDLDEVDRGVQIIFQ